MLVEQPLARPRSAKYMVLNCEWVIEISTKHNLNKKNHSFLFYPKQRFSLQIINFNVLKKGLKHI